MDFARTHRPPYRMRYKMLCQTPWVEGYWAPGRAQTELEERSLPPTDLGTPARVQCASAQAWLCTDTNGVCRAAG